MPLDLQVTLGTRGDLAGVRCLFWQHELHKLGISARSRMRRIFTPTDHANGTAKPPTRRA